MFCLISFSSLWLFYKLIQLLLSVNHLTVLLIPNLNSLSNDPPIDLKNESSRPYFISWPGLWGSLSSNLYVNSISNSLLINSATSKLEIRLSPEMLTFAGSLFWFMKASLITIFLLLRTLIENSFSVFGVDLLILISAYIIINRKYKEISIWKKKFIYGVQI